MLEVVIADTNQRLKEWLCHLKDFVSLLLISWCQEITRFLLSLLFLLLCHHLLITKTVMIMINQKQRLSILLKLLCICMMDKFWNTSNCWLFMNHQLLINKMQRVVKQLTWLLGVVKIKDKVHYKSSSKKIFFMQMKQHMLWFL